MAVVTLYGVKPRFQRVVRPAADRLVALGAAPNHVTAAALIGSIVAGGLVLTGRANPACLLVLPFWLLVRLSLNAIDGLMAREHGMATPLGAVLNETGDVVSDIAIYLPLAAVLPQAAAWVVAFVFGAALTEFCGVLAHTVGGRRRYDGPMGKSDRALFASVLAVLTVAWPAAASYWPWLLGAGAALEVVTCGNRLRGALQDAARAGSSEGPVTG